MALTSIQKLLRKPLPPSIIFSSLRNPLFPSPNSTSHHFLDPKPSESHVINFKPFLGSFKPDNSTHIGFPQFYLISQMGFLQYPVLTTGSVPDEENKDDSAMYADSVKKKRKKKMNKHKYKKLRKRMRRQT